jgi:hypothetical protein
MLLSKLLGRCLWLAIALLLTFLRVAPLAHILAAQNSSGVLTNLNNNARTGEYFETRLNPATVNTGALETFGKLHTWEVNGQIYAQPLYVRGLTLPDGKSHNVVYAATQKNFVYAFDADTFAQLWKSPQLGNPVLAKEVDCQNNISPLVGITSTPVISLTQNTIYVVAKSKDAGQYFHRLHALDLTTGKERPGSPVEIAGTVSGSGAGNVDGSIKFDAKPHLNRVGLLLSNGTIYVAFGSHGDCGSSTKLLPMAPPGGPGLYAGWDRIYHGWIFGYDATTLSRVAVFATTPSGNAGGIWQAGRGLAADQNGNIFLMTGNGSVSAQDFGSSFLRLTPDLRVSDRFLPSNHACLNQYDLDLGASGPLVLLGRGGANLLLGGGKEGYLYLFDSSSLHNPLNQVVATGTPEFDAGYCPTVGWLILGADTTHHIHAGPALWDVNGDGSKRLIYLLGENDNLKAWQVTNDKIIGIAMSKFKAYIGMPGGAVSVSHSTDATTGLLWLSVPMGDAVADIVRGQLLAFQATPNGTDITGLWNSEMVPGIDSVGLYSKFAPPTIADGKVFLGSFGDPHFVDPSGKHNEDLLRPGWLHVYGLLGSPRPLWHWVDLSYVSRGAPNGVPNAASDLSGFALDADSTQHIFYRSGNNRLNELYNDAQGWHWTDLSYVAQGAPKGVPDAAGNPFGYAFNSQGTQHVVYRGTNNRLNELYKDAQGWHWTDLSYVAQGAPNGIPDAAGNPFAYAFNSQSTQHVVYRGTNNRLNELHKDAQGWHWTDLSYIAQGAPNGVPDAASDLVGYAFEAQGTQHVFYRSANNRLNELYSDNQGWHWVDLSYVAQGAGAGKEIPDAAGNLSAYVFNSRMTQHIVYRSADNRLNELYWDSQGWHWVDLSYAAQRTPNGVPDAASDLCAFAYEPDGTQHIVYRGSNNRVNQLYSDSQGWHWMDLSFVSVGASNGVPDAAGNLFGYVFSVRKTQHVIYRGTNDRLNELWWP